MPAKETRRFHEEQRLRQPRQLFMLGAPPAGLALLTVWQVVLGHKWGSQPLSNGALIVWTIFLWLLFWRLATVRLVTDVDKDRIAIAMRGLWRARRVPLASVRAAQEVTFHPVRDYGGYGIRSTRNGKAYLAFGTTGVRVDLADGSSLVIGSQKPQDLRIAIQKS